MKGLFKATPASPLATATNTTTAHAAIRLFLAPRKEADRAGVIIEKQPNKSRINKHKTPRYERMPPCTETAGTNTGFIGWVITTDTLHVLCIQGTQLHYTPCTL